MVRLAEKPEISKFTALVFRTTYAAKPLILKRLLLEINSNLGNMLNNEI